MSADFPAPSTALGVSSFHADTVDVVLTLTLLPSTVQGLFIAGKCLPVFLLDSMYKKKLRNTWTVDGNTARLNIIRNNGAEHTYIIDLADWDKVRQKQWRVQNDPKLCPQFIYAFSGVYTGPGSVIILHRYITDATADQEVSFINHNTYDCRKSNLRVATHYESMTYGKRATKSKSGYANVIPYGRRWKAQIKRQGKTHLIGTYRSVREAVEARDKWIAEHPEIMRSG